MKKIYIYVGENVCNLDFQCGGGPAGFADGVVTYHTGATHRELPENGLHARKYARVLEAEVLYCLPYWDLHLSSNSEVTISKVAEMVRIGVLDPNQIKINVLSEDNRTIDFVSTIDKEGYLVNWPCGFMKY